MPRFLEAFFRATREKCPEEPGHGEPVDGGPQVSDAGGAIRVKDRPPDVLLGEVQIGATTFWVYVFVH
jgi:hypothetical protein